MDLFKQKAPASKNHNVSTSPRKAFFLYTLSFAALLLLLVLGSRFVGAQMAQHISQKWEQRLFYFHKKTFGFLKQQSFSQEDPGAKYIYKLFSELNKKRDLKHRSYQAEIQILCSPVVNAFALPGGTLIVSSGLLNVLESENSLAFIIAHEMGHVYQKHNLKRFLGRLLESAFMSFLNREESLKGGASLASLYSLSFDRKEEKNADLFALKLMKKHYGHVGGSHDFFEYLQLKKKNEESKSFYKIEGPSLLRSHPPTQERIDFARKFAQEQKLSLKEELVPLPPEAKKICKL